MNINVHIYRTVMSPRSVWFYFAVFVTLESCSFKIPLSNTSSDPPTTWQEIVWNQADLQYSSGVYVDQTLFDAFMELINSVGDSCSKNSLSTQLQPAVLRLQQKIGINNAYEYNRLENIFNAMTSPKLKTFSLEKLNRYDLKESDKERYDYEFPCINKLTRQQIESALSLVNPIKLSNKSYLARRIAQILVDKGYARLPLIPVDVGNLARLVCAYKGQGLTDNQIVLDSVFISELKVLSSRFNLGNGNLTPLPKDKATQLLIIHEIQVVAEGCTKKYK